ncbi:MAG: MAPEG family protein [Alphaproteobacteria bacterium]|nr:MAPEG family protein [Alphaproteobacteria bacterium]MDE2041782.1 MAPEG family protein [Alphaproteobacteria bacterium]MDE2340423.1 MAPEG family protein [Alphaproteobacteria bacterium]
MHSQILQPVVVLLGWTMVVWVWLFVRRIPALNKSETIDINKQVGGTGKDLDGLLDPRTQWPAHNFNHLHESPTLFYVVALLLAFVGAGDGMNATIAWAYVVLRIIHSFIQITYNRVLHRFIVYFLSGLALIALILHAAMHVFH